MHLLWLFWLSLERSMDLVCWLFTMWIIWEFLFEIWGWVWVLQSFAWRWWQLQKGSKPRRKSFKPHPQLTRNFKYSPFGNTPSSLSWHSRLYCSLRGQRQFLVQLSLWWCWRLSGPFCSNCVGQDALRRESRCVFCFRVIPSHPSWMECRTLPGTPSRLSFAMVTKFMCFAATEAQRLIWLQRIMVLQWLVVQEWKYNQNTRSLCHLHISCWHWCVSDLTSFSSLTSRHVLFFWCPLYGGWAFQLSSLTILALTSMLHMCRVSLGTTHHKLSERLAKSCFLWWPDIYWLMVLKRIKVGFRDIPTLVFGQLDVT